MLKIKENIVTDKKKMTLADFRAYKEEGRKFTYLTAYGYLRPVVKGAPNTFVVATCPSVPTTKTPSRRCGTSTG